MAKVKPKPKTKIWAEIHEYVAANNCYNRNGEPMIGWYWRIMKGKNPATELFGPFHTRKQAEQDCEKEWEASERKLPLNLS